MNNFIKRFSIVMGIFFLLAVFSSSFAQVAAEIDAATKELTTLPVDNLKIKLTEAENKSTTLKKEISDLEAKTKTIANKQQTAEDCEKIQNDAKAKADCEAQIADTEALGEAKTKLTELNSTELIPLKSNLSSRNSVNLKGMITIRGQGIFADAASFLGSIIDYLIRFVGLVALILIVAGGVRLVVAAGNDNAVQNAKQMIIYAIIGLALALLAYIIVTFLHGLLYR